MALYEFRLTRRATVKTDIRSVRLLALIVLIPMMIVLGGILSPSAATAATYYVATTGDDSKPGTQSQPFRTINKGMSVLKAGDVLYVRSGTYESIYSGSQTIATGTSWTNAPRIAAYPGETVSIPGIGLSASYIQYVIFDGFIIDGKGSSREGIHISRGAHHIRIQNCEIKNQSAHGILVPKESQGFNEFINLDVHHNGTREHLDHGIYISSSNNIVENSKVYENAAYGIHMYNSGSSTVNNNIVRNNTIYGNGTLPGTSYGLIFSYGKGNVAHHNLIYNNKGGVSIAWNTIDTQLYNNTIYSNSPGYGIEIYTSSTVTVVRENMIYDNPIRDQGIGTIISNNTMTDPKLASSSPAPRSLRIVSP
jgi:parallel beta-helix repeat protein